MKTLVSKSRILAILFLSIAAIGLSNCKKDKLPTLKEEVVGTWEVKSFTEDGVELMGSIVSSFSMEYDQYSGSNGDFFWQINYSDGSSERLTGDYSVDLEDRQIKLIKNDGTITMDLDASGDRIEMEGIIDGFRYVVKGKKH